ncbi:MAG: HAD-IA family hydrolase [Caldilineaceae bacterium]
MTTLFCDVILFDLDGTLVDSHAVVERQWRIWAARHGLDGDKLLKLVHGRKADESMRMVAPHLDIAKEAALLAAAETVDLDGVTAIPGVSELLGVLPSECWAIATSGSRSIATARLKHVELPVPNVLITADDVRNGKPAPDPYLLAAKRMNKRPEQCIVIEDTPAGIESALAAGMRVVAVITTHTAADLQRATVVQPIDQQMHVTIGRTGSPRLRIDVP